MRLHSELAAPGGSEGWTLLGSAVPDTPPALLDEVRRNRLLSKSDFKQALAAFNQPGGLTGWNKFTKPQGVVVPPPSPIDLE